MNVMRKRQVAKQLVLFCIVGFIASTLYDFVVIQVRVQRKDLEVLLKQEVATSRVLSTFPPRRRKLPIDCKKLIGLDQNEKYKAFMKLQHAKRINNADFIEKAKDCGLTNHF